MASGEGFLNLFTYSDSLAFRRNGQPQDLGFTYPFRVKALIETEAGLRTNLVMRGGGGVRIAEMVETVRRDLGYFGGEPHALNIAVLQFGIVDCAPRPITYMLSPLLQRVPKVGPRILAELVKQRKGIQNAFSYRVTSQRAFRRDYARIVAAFRTAHIAPVAVGLPLPPASMEARSPGFRRSAAIYNALIREAAPEHFCDIEKDMTDATRETFLLPDGHHLTEAGHALYAARIFEQVRKLAAAARHT
jgi:lysophospholipase L1-like esterase